MEWINYHHLLYFWRVAKLGSIARASAELRLAQPTISGQIRSLEDSLGEKLFRKSGRNLVLTEFGQLVYGYAESIFAIGRELMDVLEGKPAGGVLRLSVGIADVLPKQVAHRLLEPALTLGQPIQLVCHEDKPERLLSELEKRGLDLLLTDTPLPHDSPVRAFNHMLGTSGNVVSGGSGIGSEIPARLSHSLDGAPFLLPLQGTAQRAALDRWFDSLKIRPRIAGEFQDNALIQVFGQHAAGVFPVSRIIEQAVREDYKVALVGREKTLSERFYAISAERRLKHPRWRRSAKRRGRGCLSKWKSRNELVFRAKSPPWQKGSL